MLNKGRLAAIVLIMTLFAAACGAGSKGEDGSAAGGNSSSGTVTANRSVIVEAANGYVEAVEAGETIYPAVGEKLHSGQQINTETEANITLILDSDKHVYAADNTSFNLVALGKEGSSRTRLELIRGTLVCGIDNKLGSDETFTVTTPNASMAVRGTVFTTKVENKGHGEYVTTLTVTEGSIETTTIEDGKEKTVITSAGESTEFEGKAPDINEEPEEIKEKEAKLDAESERAIREDPAVADIHAVKDVNKRFEMYKNGSFHLDRYSYDETIDEWMIVKGRLYNFEDYFYQEIADAFADGKGVRYTSDMVVFSEPVTMPDGSVVTVLIQGTDIGGFCVNRSLLPMGREIEMYGHLQKMTHGPADKDDWVNLDYEIYGADSWYFALFDCR